MTRLSGTTATETQSQVVRPVWLVSMGITGGTGTYDLCAFDRDITWGATTYKHTSFVIQPMQEREDGSIASQSVSFALGEQDLATVLGTEANYVWKSLDITLVLVDDTGSPLADAVYAWKGYMTARSVQQAEGSGSIQVVGQDQNSLLGQTGRIRFDDVSQQARASGDTFFAAMPGLQGQHVLWMGTNGVLSGGFGGGGGGGAVKIILPDGSIKWA